MLKQNLVDWKKNNKIALRNFTESSDHHDIIKTLMVRMLRRKYPDSYKVPIYTEFDPNKPNEDYPDIWMRLPDKSIIVYEIQKEVTKKWQEDIIKKYSNVDLIIIPTKKLSQNLKKLKEQLQDYII